VHLAQLYSLYILGSYSAHLRNRNKSHGTASAQSQIAFGSNFLVVASYNSAVAWRHLPNLRVLKNGNGKKIEKKRRKRKLLGKYLNWGFLVPVSCSG
jgi:hypothetical protein